MKPLRTLTSLLLALVLASPALAAPPEGKGKPDNKSSQSQHGDKDKSKGNDKGNKGKKGKAWHDDDNDGRYEYDTVYLRGYVQDNRYSGYSSLPPGIRKNLARGKPLPPGLQSRVVPPEMLHELPYRAGYEWRVYGSDLVLYSITSGLVDEVLQDIFFD